MSEGKKAATKRAVMSEARQGRDDPYQASCQLAVDTERNCLFLEFTDPINVFAFDLETAESFYAALQEGISILRSRMDS